MTEDIGPIYERTEGFESNELPDGYVIYDETRETVHFLNITAAALLELCDGSRGPAEMAEVLRDAFDLPASPRAEVEACLDSLLAKGLVRACIPSSSEA